MQKIGNAMHGGISFSEEDRMRGVGPAEECQNVVEYTVLAVIHPDRYILVFVAGAANPESGIMVHFTGVRLD